MLDRLQSDFTRLQDFSSDLARTAHADQQFADSNPGHAVECTR
jgi:hypothetical protein